MQELSASCSYMHECARKAGERVARQGANGWDLTPRTPRRKGFRFVEQLNLFASYALYWLRKRGCANELFLSRLKLCVLAPRPHRYAKRCGRALA